ncbi:hypothetical protein PAXRUDRAFT_131222 [Paxillus rubicundulus Ve08.2h10]|uniref:Unplaced genomic scaffold scaffold_27, whole genome shotgun sequence n=1 Tax=Paxillus rubicundulus Ve08.2h10 TaxID=930991 RepID=A0A0D0E9Y7_9AGAM|nr:hypothetical protein PAXRUDRAFT_131222 [Paxillus rubicundulus Ve08.2h10]
MATFFAPSDLSRIKGMHCKHIRATPLWQHGPACYDTIMGKSRDVTTILVIMDGSADSINGMDVTWVLCLFSFLSLDKMFLCALVHWYKHISSQPDSATGLWVVHPSFKDDRSHKLSIIHLNSIFCAVHLLPMFSSSDPIHSAVNFHNSLDAFKGYYSDSINHCNVWPKCNVQSISQKGMRISLSSGDAHCSSHSWLQIGPWVM